MQLSSLETEALEYNIRRVTWLSLMLGRTQDPFYASELDVMFKRLDKAYSISSGDMKQVATFVKPVTK